MNGNSADKALIVCEAFAENLHALGCDFILADRHGESVGTRSYCMRARISQRFDALRTGFWFVPSIMLVLAAVLALTLLYVDERVDPGTRESIAWAYSGGPEGARSLFSTIAGSMVTAASFTFLSAVPLSIAAQQYGSRLLCNFMRDRVTQVLLGTFVSTFLYRVLVVREMRGSDFSGGFFPATAITAADVMLREVDSPGTAWKERGRNECSEGIALQKCAILTRLQSRSVCSLAPKSGGSFRLQNFGIVQITPAPFGRRPDRHINRSSAAQAV